MAEGLVGSKPNKDALVIGCQEMDPLIVIVIVVVVIISVIIAPLSDFIEIQQIQGCPRHRLSVNGSPHCPHHQHVSLVF